MRLKFWKRPAEVPAEVDEIRRRTEQARDYVDEQVAAAEDRAPEVREESGWLEWRRGQNHLSPLLFPAGHRGGRR